MLDLNDDSGAVRKKKYRSPIPGGAAPASSVASSKLDDAKLVKIQRRLLDLYIREMDRQFDNRVEAAIDEDFYDNIQWRESDAQTLRDRGQVPLVYNVLSSAVNWVIGTEKRGRSEGRVLPRRKEEGKPAERKTQILKYLSDTNTTPFHRSRAFEDAVKTGLGWLEDGVSDDGEGEPIYSRYENWRNIIWDSTSTEGDLSDARYIFRTKWADVDVTKAWFPKRQWLIDKSAADADAGYFLDDHGDEPMDQAEIETQRGGESTRSDRVLGYERRRVRLIEGWFRMPTDIRRLKGGAFHGELFDDQSPGHVESVDNGEAEIITRVGMRVYVAIFTAAGFLYFGPSPYRHNKYPFTPIWGYRRSRDGLPYGMIRGLRDIQEDINKRASKALHILSTSKTIMDKGAVDDLDEYIEEASRPDAVIVKNPGKSLEISADRDLSQWHMELMQRSISMIQSVSGVTDELRGLKTNATSGIAIQRRQDQGSMSTTKFFDNLRFAMQWQGEKQLSLVEQFMSEKKAFRITNMRGAPEYIEVNDGLPENDIVRCKADYVMSDADWRASTRQAAADELLEAITRLPPEVSLVLIDLVVENMDLPNREEIVRRIRAVTGQRDPDADEPTPEEQQQAQVQAKRAALQDAMSEAQLRLLIAEVIRTEAQAEQAKAMAVKTNVGSLGGPKRGAVDIAAYISTAPGLAPLTDGIMAEMGFKSQTDEEDGRPGQPPPGQPQAVPGLGATAQ